jgi:hypothetical protein
VLLKTTLKVPVLAGALVVLACAVFEAAQGQPAPQGSGLITGQVVDADSGKGIPFAAVARKLTSVHKAIKIAPKYV